MKRRWEGWVAMLLLIVADNAARGQNNNAPVFSEPAYDVSLAEDNTGVAIWVANVTDPDSGRAGQVTFRVNDTKKFYMNDDELRYFCCLDYEKPELRETVLRITATDRGSPRKSTDALVYIHLTDVNDARPVFSQTFYTPKIVNGSPKGTSVVQVLAEDQDTPVIYYYVSGENPFFQIDNLTGIITASQKVNRSLIVENRKESFFIDAEDGSPRLTLVRVTPVIVEPNLHGPGFTGEPYETSIDEGETDTVAVITVSAEDEDPHTKDIRYHIVSAPHSDKFIVSELTGQITLNGTFDRESLSEANDTILLEVTATDNGLPPATSTTTVKIRINDMNDNGPEFDNESHEIILFEDFKTGLSFDLPTATDKDMGTNAKILYTMSGDGGHIFEIDQTTGRVTTRINCETDCGKLGNSTYMEFFLNATSAGDRNIPGDAMRIIVHIRKLPTTFPPPNTRPTKEKPNDPVLSSTEITVIVVVLALVVLIIFIIVIILVCRRRTSENEKIKITPPQNPRPIQLEDEVCY